MLPFQLGSNAALGDYDCFARLAYLVLLRI